MSDIWLPPTLETQRLILRAMGEDDVPAVFEYAKNPNVSRFTMWEPHDSLEDTYAFIRNYVFKRYQNQEPEPLGICLKDNPAKVIGSVGCFWQKKEHRCMEMGYVLSEDYWGQGLMAEAAQTILHYCFSNYQVDRIQAHFKQGNEASGRVMEKIGMQYEGLMRSSVFHREQYWDTKHYAILRRDLQH